MGQEARFAAQAAFVAPEELSKFLMNALTPEVSRITHRTSIGTTLCFSGTFPHSESTLGLSGPVVHEFHSNIPLEHHHQFLSCQRRDGHRPASCSPKSNNVPPS